MTCTKPARLRVSSASGDIGLTNNGWDTNGTLFNAQSSLAGDTRHFQVFYRDLETGPCARLQNTTNAVSVTFVP